MRNTKTATTYKKLLCTFVTHRSWLGWKSRLDKNLLIRFIKWGVDRLLESSGDLYKDHKHLWRFNELIIDGENSIRGTLVPREPFCFVCHGDSNRNNNMMFRSTCCFDFGTGRNDSPALDIPIVFLVHEHDSKFAWNSVGSLTERVLLDFKGIRTSYHLMSAYQTRLNYRFRNGIVYLIWIRFALASLFVPHQLEPNAIFKNEGILECWVVIITRWWHWNGYCGWYGTIDRRHEIHECVAL